MLSHLTLLKASYGECEHQHGTQDWGDVYEPRDHPGSRTRRTGEDLIEWTPIQQYQLKYVSKHCTHTVQHSQMVHCILKAKSTTCTKALVNILMSAIPPVACHKHDPMPWFSASDHSFRLQPLCSVPVCGPNIQVKLYPGLSVPCRVDDQLRVPRGTQRAIGALMLTTPSGSDRHYTMDFAQFCDRYTKDPVFAEWLKPSHDDIINLATGDNWKGQAPFPMG